jgi:hypothetical protein
MGVIKKFKDFFKSKPKEETRAEKINRVTKGITDRLNSIKEEISDLFYDFEDLGAEVSIDTIYKNFVNEGPRGYLKVKIVFPPKKIEDVDPNLPQEIKRCLIESRFRMDEIPGAEVDRANYTSNYTNNQSFSPQSIKRDDVIYMPKWGGETPESSLRSSSGYIVKMWTGDMKGKGISKLNSLIITIYTKPIVPNPEDMYILTDE